MGDHKPNCPFYLGHKALRQRDGAVDIKDSLDILSGWLKKKDVTTLWCIKDKEDELSPFEEMSLLNKANWSFKSTQPSVRVPPLPEPLVIPNSIFYFDFIRMRLIS